MRKRRRRYQFLTQQTGRKGKAQAVGDVYCKTE